MKKIAVEEHANEADLNKLDKRLADMEEAGIDMQILSYPMVNIENLGKSEILDNVRKANDLLSNAVAKHPDKFAAYAAIAPQLPEESAVEIERAVKQLGLKGVLMFHGQGGDYLDDEKYLPLFETVEKLDVPFYIHPGMLLPDMKTPYMKYPILSMAMWGFAAGVGLHALRLICSGLFEKRPGLKIMLGHLGEAIPFFLWRMDKHYIEDQPVIGKDAPGNDLKKMPSEYFKKHFYITTSGMLWDPVMEFVNRVMGSDHILFACDYPPESAAEASKFIDEAPLSQEDKEKICHLNAEKMFRL